MNARDYMRGLRLASDTDQGLDSHNETTAEAHKLNVELTHLKEMCVKHRGVISPEATLRKRPDPKTLRIAKGFAFARIGKNHRQALKPFGQVALAKPEVNYIIAEGFKHLRRALLNADAMKHASLADTASMAMEAISVRFDTMKRALETGKLQCPAYHQLLSTAIENLQALSKEYDCQMDPQSPEEVLVNLDPVTFWDVTLGPFVLRVNVHGNATTCAHLSSEGQHHPDGNPHPHADTEGYLCLGDALVPITAAMREGRLFDVVEAAVAVVETYQPDSAYVAVKDWSTSRCGSCGALGEGWATCAGCGVSMCEDCTVSCDCCGDTVCPECSLFISHTAVCLNCTHWCDYCGRRHLRDESDTCITCDHIICEDCRVMCDNCGDVYCPDCDPMLEDQNGRLCPDCFDHVHEAEETDEIKEEEENLEKATVHTNGMG